MQLTAFVIAALAACASANQQDLVNQMKSAAANAQLSPSGSTNNNGKGKGSMNQQNGKGQDKNPIYCQDEDGMHGNNDGDKDGNVPEGAMAMGDTIQLAQVSQSTSTCSTTRDRHMAGNSVDFYSVYDGSSPYNDPDFYGTRALYWPEFASNVASMANYEPSVTWTRAYDYAQSNNNTLWGTDGIAPNDIRQGAIGNCWFLAAASSLAEVPGRLESVFLNDTNEIRASGIYGFNFYALGVPVTVVIDDYLPMWGNSTLFAKMGPDSGLWGPLLEKAFAKYHGNYENIVGGWSDYAVRTLHGSPSTTLYHSQMTADAIWAELTAHDASDEIITFGTPGSSDSSTDDAGLVQRHAFSVLRTATLSNGTRLVQCRNPWGSERWVGDWSDDSSLWTEALKAEVGGVTSNSNDGKFWMSIEDYQKRVEVTWVSFDTRDMQSDSFVMIDDPATQNGSFSWCGATCTRHELSITSDIAQDVYVSLQLWDPRGQTDECKPTWNDIQLPHSLYVEGDNYVRTFWRGSQFNDAMSFSAGQTKTVTIELDLSSAYRANVPKDWSVVAWGDQGAVSVNHSDSTLTSHSFTTISKRDGSSDGGDGGDDNNPPTPDPPAPTPDPPAPTPDPTPQPDPVDPKYVEFVDWVNSFSVDYPEPYCGVQIREEYVPETYSYRIRAHNSCGVWWSYQTTLWMYSEEWQAIKYAYETEDAAGNVITQNNMTGDCEVSGPLTGCSFILDADHPRFGVQVPDNGWGMMYTSDSFYF